MVTKISKLRVDIGILKSRENQPLLNNNNKTFFKERFNFHNLWNFQTFLLPPFPGIEGSFQSKKTSFFAYFPLSSPSMSLFSIYSCLTSLDIRLTREGTWAQLTKWSLTTPEFRVRIQSSAIFIKWGIIDFIFLFFQTVSKILFIKGYQWLDSNPRSSDIEIYCATTNCPSSAIFKRNNI